MFYKMLEASSRCSKVSNSSSRCTHCTAQQLFTTATTVPSDSGPTVCAPPAVTIGVYSASDDS